ncbi:hypothetical protein [Aquitalea sp. FJL05]|uniref:hypothetical protein n=1 Tax=Aquitalea sp. FJL05 TaxID=2153366 RepID=UPI000F59424D|nr:hypothetical protein [Aquitalea sp. FJL05]
MWRLPALLGGLTIGWWGLLWLVLPLSWQRISPSAILLLHIVPPVAATLAIRWWGVLRQRREQAAQQAAAASAETERTATREAARQQHQNALRERQYTIDCRWLYGTALPVKDEADWLTETDSAYEWESISQDDIEADNVLDAITPLLQEALSRLYAEAAGAAWLPLYTEVIPTLSGIEQLDALKTAQLEAVQQSLGLQQAPSQDCRFLPGNGPLAERVAQVLQQTPELPGLVVLAADAPGLPFEEDDDSWQENSPDPELAWRGRPGIALVAMLFLRSDLPQQDAAVSPVTAAVDDQPDPYQPYWEKNTVAGSPEWGPVPPSFQASLAALPLLAQLATASRGPAAMRAMQLARQLQSLLDNALVNGRLLDYPFSEEDAQPDNNRATSLAWLSHNSGDVDVGGTRLSALSGALSRHQIELHPIDQASNSVREWGDVGAATTALLTAQAITRSTQLGAPVMLVQFSHDEACLSVIRPTVEEIPA